MNFLNFVLLYRFYNEEDGTAFFVDGNNQL